jgi:hypothetical protein
VFPEVTCTFCKIYAGKKYATALKITEKAEIAFKMNIPLALPATSLDMIGIILPINL